MPKEAEVVIIGGGAIGTSIAYHLAKQVCATRPVNSNEVITNCGIKNLFGFRNVNASSVIIFIAGEILHKYHCPLSYKCTCGIYGEIYKANAIIRDTALKRSWGYCT